MYPIWNIAKKYAIWLFALVYCITVIMLFTFKENYHVDEVYTYGLSNNTVYDGYRPSFEDEQVITPASKLYQNYMTVQKGRSFDYKNVWVKNGLDVHPPLYYVMVHTVCSFFPETFSMWYAASVNILFGVINMLLVYAILKQLLDDQKVVYIALVAYIFTAGFLHEIMFLRMYVMLTTWILALVYVTLRMQQGKMKMGVFFPLVYLFSACGVLTQYFMAIFLVGYCLVLGLRFLVRKEYKNLLFFILAMTAAVVTVVAVYPVCLKHIFSGYRGQDVFNNLVETSLGQRITEFFYIANRSILGESTKELVFTVMVLTAYQVALKKKKSLSIASSLFQDCWVILIPAALYFVFVAKTVPYLDERYVSPVFPLIFIMVVVFPFRLMKDIRIKNILITILLGVFLVAGWKTCRWDWLYRYDTGIYTYSTEHANRDCVGISTNSRGGGSNDIIRNA